MTNTSKTFFAVDGGFEVEVSANWSVVGSARYSGLGFLVETIGNVGNLPDSISPARLKELVARNSLVA